MAQEFLNRPLADWSGYFVLFIGFVLTLVIQLVYYRRILSGKATTTAYPNERPISVLLTVRNESERIEQFLQKLLNQNYSNFEIVVIDDFSGDSTLIILGVMAQKHPRIKFSSLNQENRFSEKMAMNLAMKAAKNDWVLFLTPETNLDDPDYLMKMNQSLDSDSQMLVSYVNYAPESRKFNRWCRIERMDAFWRASANKAASIPLFFQEINILFNKQLYFETGGFKGKMNAHYAGLELIFNQFKSLKVRYSILKQTSLHENRLADKNEFSELIRKHIRLFRGLGFSKRWFSIFELFAKMLLLAGLIILLFTDLRYWFIFLPVPFVLLLVHLVMVKILFNRLAERKIFLSSFVYVFIRPFIHLFYSASIYLQVQRNKWN